MRKTDIRYRDRLLAQLEQDADYTRAIDLLYVKADNGTYVPRFALALAKRFAHPSLESRMRAGHDISDESKESLIDATLRFVNQGEERVKSRQTVEKWYDGRTTLAIPATMTQLGAGNNDSLSNLSQRFGSGDVHDAYYDLRLKTRAFNEEFKASPALSSETKTGGPSGSGHGSGKLAEHRKKVREAKEKLHVDDVYLQVPARLVEAWPLTKVPENGIPYEREKLHSTGDHVSLQTVHTDRILVGAVLQESLHTFFRTLIDEREMFSRVVSIDPEGLSLFCGGVHKHLTHHYGRMLDTNLKGRLEQLQEDENLRDLPMARLGLEMDRLHADVYLSMTEMIMEEIVTRETGVSLAPGIINSAFETNLRLSRHLPRLYWKNMDLVHVPNSESEGEKIMQQLRETFDINTNRSRCLVDAAMIDMGDLNFYCRHEDLRNGWTKPYTQLRRRYVLA
ncbi:MAG: hypothetical protein QGF25_07080 [Candidatus Woesearchaeota archaeon]|nr:hypothetical protein [Candidatus Woesearchaeota archaeon]MDP7467971.1 hypothetical protein [Candidatus Woesearchaeota archaeon]MDP7646638.1 hypothetical protein [Candidatus Woesearchaeota archaeon]